MKTYSPKFRDNVRQPEVSNTDSQKRHKCFQCFQLENQQFLESQDNTYNLITLILGVLPRIKIDICLTNDLYKNGHKVFVTNNQKHEKTQVFNQLKDK